MTRVGLPHPGRSTLMTSAPRSESSLPQYSPATDPASSTIRVPLSAGMSGFGASRTAQPPFGREVQVVVLHHVVEALVERAPCEVDGVVHVVLDHRQHALDHARQQAAE